MTDAPATEQAIARWHEIINTRDHLAAGEAVSDPIVVNGPKGAGPISAKGFVEWIDRSGIELRARSFHPISTRVMVVEQQARWPQTPEWEGVATVFRVTSNKVSAAR